MKHPIGGMTAQMCQDALIQTLQELFAGERYNGQKGRKPLKIYRQDLPIPEATCQSCILCKSAYP